MSVELSIERPGKVIAIGLNYRDHAEESGATLPTSPISFAKWPSSLIGSGADIVIPPDVAEVDYEAELGVIIGAEVRNVPTSQALSTVRGYICANDVSAREVQRIDGQWTRGKSFDTFGPVGPKLVAAEDVPDPQNLRIRCRVNGETLQDAHTSNMIFPVADLISFVSRYTTLHPGDLILTGTPGGVGMGRTPQRFLAAGDVVEVEIERLGVLTNGVRRVETDERDGP